MESEGGSMLNKNEEYTVSIEDIGNDGEGVGRIEGIAVFVKDTVMGDVARIKITKAKKTYAYGRLVELVEKSKWRTTPVCPNAARCGGCSLQHISYEKQLDYKWNKVKNCLQRIGGIEHPESLMDPIVGMDNPYRYRNKAQFPVQRDEEGHVNIGFYAGRTHTVIDTDMCYIQAEVNDEIIRVIRKYIEDYTISTYNEVEHKGLVRHVLTRVGFATGELMVCLVVNGSELSHSDKLIEELTKIPGMTSISININTDKTNRILGDKCITLWGQDYITDYIGDIMYQISPLSFYQVNPMQTKVLYDKALEYVDLQGDEIVWDLYCGIGTISLFLAKKAKMVYGVEIVERAIEDARHNAKINHIDNVEFFVGKAEEVVEQEYEQDLAGKKASVVVVDPPRKGCDESLLDTLMGMAPDRIVYVSCDPATLARDIKILGEGKGGCRYKVEKVSVVDQFGHSGHVETVVLLSQQHVDHHIEVDLDLYELDATSAETKATYSEIQQYVLKETGLMVSNLYIAQVKKKCGIDVGKSFNKPKSENAKQPKCPEDKEKAIKDALKHFGMI